MEELPEGILNDVITENADIIITFRFENKRTEETKDLITKIKEKEARFELDN